MAGDEIIKTINHKIIKTGSQENIDITKADYMKCWAWLGTVRHWKRWLFIRHCMMMRNTAEFLMGAAQKNVFGKNRN